MGVVFDLFGCGEIYSKIFSEPGTLEIIVVGVTF